MEFPRITYQRLLAPTVLWVALVFPTTASQYNVLLITLDDMRTSIGAYGDPHAITPNMDRLAQSSLMFNAAYCQNSFCGPSRASIFTGLNAWATGISSGSSSIATIRSVFPSRTFLAEHFKNNGYHTESFGKVEHQPDYTRSWDSVHLYSSTLGASSNLVESTTLSGKGIDAGGVLKIEKWDVPDHQFDDGKTALNAANAIRSLATSTQPWFLGVGFKKPHTPWVAPKPYYDLYDPATIELLPEPSFEEQEIPIPELREFAMTGGEVTPEMRQTAIAGYLGNVSFVDAQIGLLLDALDQENLWSSTIVVLLSDHGFMLGEHIYAWHKKKMFDECMRVPLTIYVPDAAGNGSVCSRVVELVNLYPTLSELCGLPTPPDAMHGRSMASLVANPQEKWDYPAFFVRTNKNQSYPWSRGLRFGAWKYGEYRNGDKALYNLEEDPRELNNRANETDMADTQALIEGLFEQGQGLFINPYYTTSTSSFGDSPDRDGDGILDGDELELSPFGLDVNLNDTALLNDLEGRASTFGLLRPDELGQLEGNLVLERDNSNDMFTATLHLEAQDHLDDWQPAGSVEWEFDDNSPRRFMRVSASESP